MTDEMSVKELRRLVAEIDAYGVPDTATFGLNLLTRRGVLLASWEEPAGSGTMTGLHLRRKCDCGHPECPDRDL